jgi:hypothetical protein
MQKIGHDVGSIGKEDQPDQGWNEQHPSVSPLMSVKISRPKTTGVGYPGQKEVPNQKMKGQSATQIDPTDEEETGQPGGQQ